MPALTDAFSQGLHADRPAAAPANAGYYFFETDTNGGTLFQSTGAVWVQLGAGVSAGSGSGGVWTLTILNPTTDSFVLDQANCLVIVDPGVGADTVELPDAASHAGQVVIVKGIGTGPFVFVPGGGDGAENQGSSICAWVSDGTVWRNVWHVD